MYPSSQENQIAIEVNSLSKSVVDKASIAQGEGENHTLTILDDISFTIERGTTTAIVGTSGSGKSTLLGLLAGLDLPTSGEVKIDGNNIYGMNEDQRALLRKDKIGFVFQSFQLLGHLNALENVMLPLELRNDKQAESKAKAMLSHVGLGNRLTHFPKYLSGGEQQRVALARAFVTQPQLLFADEPTGSLDTVTGQQVMNLMFDMNREYQSTLIIVTHDLSIAAKCQNKITISAGRLV